MITKPDISIIVPIYNEEEILIESIHGLLSHLDSVIGSSDYELLLCENGSTDTTLAIAEKLGEQSPQVRVEHLAIASYGRALKHGIDVASGRLLIIFNADFWDTEFVQKALTMRNDFDILVGSKSAIGAIDRRPLFRRGVTFAFGFLLRTLFGYQGTDTHGLKALNADRTKPLARQCLTDAEIFDTELLLRAQNAQLRIVEVPIQVEERRPSRYSLLKRVPRTVKDLYTLTRSLGRASRPGRTAVRTSSQRPEG